MSAEINPGRDRPRRRLRLLSAAALSSAALLVAGCGSAAKPTAAAGTAPARSTSTTATHATTTTTAAARSTPAHEPSSAHKTIAPGPLAFSECMRANGVSGFPDPTPGKGYQVSASVSSSPAFHTAQRRCQRFLAGPGGFQSNPSKHTMAKLLRIATCMRAHRIHQFPDPLYTRPRRLTPGEYQEITDFDGATLLFPANMDLQAPAYRQALSACGAPPLGLPH